MVSCGTSLVVVGTGVGVGVGFGVSVGVEANSLFRPLHQGLHRLHQEISSVHLGSCWCCL